MLPKSGVKNHLKSFLAVFRHPISARLLRASTWVLGAGLLGFSLLLLLLRFVVLPQVNNYRGDIEHALSNALQLPVSIGSVEGHMQGIRPRLELRGLAIKDQTGRPALSFDNVAGVVAWTSIFKLSPRFYLLEIATPVLAIRRDADGHVFVAGLAVNTNKSGPDVSAWVLDQHAIAIRDATLTWTDEKRQAPPLVLDHLNLQLEKTVVGRHRFGLTAQPPAALAARLDWRGEFSGNSLAEVEHWAGKLYGQVDHIDLAAWHPWIDYPLQLTQGHGAARLWLDFAAMQPKALTADVSLADVQTRLAPDLVALSLRYLNGRVVMRREKNGFELTTRQLSLATNDGITVAPTDMHLQRDDAGGDFTVNKMDFQALASLAAHLPLPVALRQQIASYAPRGLLNQFHFAWRGQQWPFKSYEIKGGFSKLALASVGKQPGLSGVSGSIEGDEKAGTLMLAGNTSSLSLPTVFLQPILLDMLDARVLWKRTGANTELKLVQAQFRNADAEGTASGSYVIHPKGVGIIDLDARLAHAAAAAVWRYMPLQAGPHVGPFLQAGLSQGKATDVTLKLKGDLDKFPFSDHSGIFRIHGLINDGVLHYAEGWPRLEGVKGELDFDGPGMVISAKEARILGVRVSPAKAVIADLGSHDPQLLVEGKVAGPTADFLKFIEASPVGEQIDHFTRDMTAKGNGELDLKLVLPLNDIEKSTVLGNYRFDNNRIFLDPGMPPLDEVKGRLEFSADVLSAKGITATVFGMPMKLDLKSQGDGSVLSEASGDINAAQLQKQFSYAGLKNLVGSTRWKGTVRARKNSAEVRISSDLVGLSSTLPEPFNKSAKDTMPLLYERKAADPRLFARRPRDKSSRNLEELSLGQILRAQLVYRQDAEQSVFERGAISLGSGAGLGDAAAATKLPASGLTMSVVQPRVDVDLWRALLTENDPKMANPKALAASNPDNKSDWLPNRIDFRTAELHAMGRAFRDVKVVAVRPANVWLADVSSQEVMAKLTWAGGDNPKLSGRVSRFNLQKAITIPSTPPAVVVGPPKSLPDLDLTVDRLLFNGRDYGELRLAAENKGADWNATYSVRNDDGLLDGQGRWRTASAPPSSPTITPATTVSDTQTDFKLHARNLDRFLTRIGYPNTVKRGSADLGGRLAWKGAPSDFDVAALSGKLALEARDGQFNKLDPGVGRLFGILSLQSLPRRINLDFRDIFSDGLAFDSVKGQIAMANGVLNTQDMQIQAPAARIQMAGSVDLNTETQDLKVRVQPKLSASVAAGVLLASPAIGATAWVFNKLFGNPLDNVFAYDYVVNGSWTDPKVEKAGAQPGAQSGATAAKEGEGAK